MGNWGIYAMDGLTRGAIPFRAIPWTKSWPLKGGKKLGVFGLERPSGKE